MESQPHYYQGNWFEEKNEEVDVDVCVYGGTAAGIMAAVTATQEGLRVTVLHPGRFIGGMTTGGLGYTDIGNKEAIGGLARQFYRSIGQRSGVEELWKFPPHLAQETIEEVVEEQQLEIRRACYLSHVIGSSSRIEKIVMLGGLSVSARCFIDATYEGDLMAMAGVSYATGRESNTTYGESHNGFQMHESHQFDCPVDPYIREGHPESGLLPYVVPEKPTESGSGDRRIQAYNFRVCMTDDPEIRIPFAKPADYDPALYEIALRWLRCTTTDVFRKFDRVTKNKTDTNNHGAVSTDFIGANWRWPEASHAEREVIFQRHVQYQRGLQWFMSNDVRVPDKIRGEYSRWGLARDEFSETENWPHQLYVREARRMVSSYVITELDCMGKTACDDPVGMAAYQMDSHNCARIVQNGRVRNEGDVQIRLTAPFPISFRSIIPKGGEVENLIVPVCLSASHIAFGSIRMEPVFMILGESAGVIASLALTRSEAVQRVPYNEVRKALERRGQVLSTTHENRGPINPK